MAVITEFQEDEEVTAAKAVGGSDDEVLSAVLARQGGPLPFIQAAIDVARKRSDLFRYPSGEMKVAAMAAAARAQVEAEERRRKTKEEARNAAERRRKEAARSGAERKMEDKAKSTEKAKMKVEEEGKGVREPNAENGLDLEKYSWTQQLPEVNVTVPVPQGTKSKFVICEIEKNHLKVGLKSQSAIIDGELYQSVKVGECFWCIEDGESLSILLTKQNQKEWWKSVIKGDPEMDMRKVKPKMKLSDLDPETRETIQKAIINRRRKEMGLPTSDEIQKQELLKNLMAQTDFSRENMV